MRLNPEELEKVSPEKRQFVLLLNDFGTFIELLGGYMHDKKGEDARRNCLDRITEAAMWFKSYWDVMNPPKIESIIAVEKERNVRHGTQEKN